MRHPTRILFAVLFALAVLLPACKDTGRIPVTSGRGTIAQGLAPECPKTWFLQTDSGAHYQLTNLAPEFQQSGLRVRFALKVREDMASACMAGAIADVTWIEK